jgi:hypothetical protein
VWASRVNQITIPRPPSFTSPQHKSPSKLRHDEERQRFHEDKVRTYVENEKLFLEATAHRDNVPDSPGRGDVVALFDSPGLDVNKGDVMRNSRRRHLHPSFKKFLRQPDFEITDVWANDVRAEMH